MVKTLSVENENCVVVYLDKEVQKHKPEHCIDDPKLHELQWYVKLYPLPYSCIFRPQMEGQIGACSCRSRFPSMSSHLENSPDWF